MSDMYQVMKLSTTDLNIDLDLSIEVQDQQDKTMLGDGYLIAEIPKLVKPQLSQQIHSIAKESPFGMEPLTMLSETEFKKMDMSMKLPMLTCASTQN